MIACISGNIRAKATSSWHVCAEPEDLEDPRVIQEQVAKRNGSTCRYTENLNEERRDGEEPELREPKAGWGIRLPRGTLSFPFMRKSRTQGQSREKLRSLTQCCQI